MSCLYNKSLLTVVLCSFVCLGSQLAKSDDSTSDEKQPNFIIIYCDDLGYGDIEPFGSELHRTPNLSRMASEGMRLTNFYSTCCVCTPSRSSLMTGCYPKRIGMHESEKGQWVLFPGNGRGINAEETTIPELLKPAGYSTAIIGKWHLGDQPEFLPTRHGFDYYFGVPYSNDMGKMDRPIQHRYPPTPLLRNEQVIEMEPDQRYITRRYTEEALKFIEANREKPFFLYLPHSMPHWPQYSSKNFAYQSRNKSWGDSVEEIDWSTGQILDKLTELDLDDNTFVVFASDNGGAIQHGAKNGPLRGGKGSTWEGGQRVCCVARWPGRITPNSVTDSVAVTFDLLPTIARLAGAELSSDRKIDGRDLAGVLFDKKRSPHEAFYYYFRGHINAVRVGPWKLFIKRKQKKLDQPELYNLNDDIGEKTNVAMDNPAVIERLNKHIAAMQQELGDGADFPGNECRTAGSVSDPVTLTMNAPNRMTQQAVFESGTEGYHTFRIPSLIVSPSGNLIATCEGRKTGRGDHGDLDLVMKRSTDLGKTWSSLKVIYEEGGDQKITIGNPCPVVDQETGTIWMPFCKNNDQVFMTHSNDDGVTWEPPIEITSQVKKPDWSWYATGPGVGIQLTRGTYNGRLVIPCDHRELSDGKSVKRSHCFYSDDHGKTWQLGESVADHTDECQIAELHDGRLMINMRNYWAVEGGKPEHGGKRSFALSDNGGKSWGELQFHPKLVEPVCQASFHRHNSDAYRKSPLLFSNPASTNKRSQLTIRMSTDQGKTWPIARTIHEGPSAYSCLTTLSDRSVGCLFEAGKSGPYEKIIFARFSLPWLQESKAQSN